MTWRVQPSKQIFIFWTQILAQIKGKGEEKSPNKLGSLHTW